MSPLALSPPQNKKKNQNTFTSSLLEFYLTEVRLVMPRIAGEHTAV